MNKSCKKCLFGDICPRTRPCNDFSPLDEMELVDYHEARDKREYYQAWLEYIQDFD
jgi:hypothetical protein